MLESSSSNTGFLRRRVQRAASAEELRVDESLASADEAAAVHWDTEEFELEEEGMVIFDGGSFSRGPFSLGARCAADAGLHPRSCAMSVLHIRVPAPSLWLICIGSTTHSWIVTEG